MLCKEESPSRVFLRLPIETTVWFGDRYDVCQFPDMRYFVFVDCSVVYVREVL